MLSHPVSRVGWNASLIVLLLFEAEVTVQHNSSSAFAIRPTYMSWQTIVALPAIFLLDIACAWKGSRGKGSPGDALIVWHACLGRGGVGGAGDTASCH